MILSTVRPTDEEITSTVQKYSDALFRLCFSILCNYADAEDAVSETIIKYIKKSPLFNDEEHKKAWLIKTASNVCKDKRSVPKNTPLTQSSFLIFFAVPAIGT